MKILILSDNKVTVINAINGDIEFTCCNIEVNIHEHQIRLFNPMCPEYTLRLLSISNTTVFQDGINITTILK